MKSLTFIFCLLVSMNVLAQSVMIVPQDFSIKNVKIETLPGRIKNSTLTSIATPPGSNLDLNKLKIADSTTQAPIYIIDGLEATSNNNIKPADIFSTTIVKPNDAVKIYGHKADSGAVIITTKAFAQKLYQQKLNPFSKKYAAYMAAHGDDSKLLYVINNTMLIAGTNRTLRELSDLEPDNIKEVSFKRDSRYVSDATVVITTKDYDKPADF